MDFGDPGEDLDEANKELEKDSQASRHTNSRLGRKAHLELLIQKANSVGGIRKMNM